MVESRENPNSNTTPGKTQGNNFGRGSRPRGNNAGGRGQSGRNFSYMNRGSYENRGNNSGSQGRGGNTGERGQSARNFSYTNRGNRGFSHSDFTFTVRQYIQHIRPTLNGSDGLDPLDLPDHDRLAQWNGQLARQQNQPAYNTQQQGYQQQDHQQQVNPQQGYQQVYPQYGYQQVYPQQNYGYQQGYGQQVYPQYGYQQGYGQQVYPQYGYQQDYGYASTYAAPEMQQQASSYVGFNNARNAGLSRSYCPGVTSFGNYGSNQEQTGYNYAGFSQNTQQASHQLDSHYFPPTNYQPSNQPTSIQGRGNQQAGQRGSFPPNTQKPEGTQQPENGKSEGQ